MIVYHKNVLAKMASMKDDESTDKESNEESRDEERNMEEALDSKSKRSLKIRKVIPA